MILAYGPVYVEQGSNATASDSVNKKNLTILPELWFLAKAPPKRFDTPLAKRNKTSPRIPRGTEALLGACSAPPNLVSDLARAVSFAASSYDPLGGSRSE